MKNLLQLFGYKTSTDSASAYHRISLHGGDVTVDIKAKKSKSKSYGLRLEYFLVINSLNPYPSSGRIPTYSLEEASHIISKIGGFDLESSSKNELSYRNPLRDMSISYKKKGAQMDLKVLQERILPQAEKQEVTLLPAISTFNLLSPTKIDPEIDAHSINAIAHWIGRSDHRTRTF